MQTKMEYDQMIQILEQMISNFEFMSLAAKDIDDLSGIEYAEYRIAALKLAVYSLKEYIESWNCPMCGYHTKIPHDHKDKRACPKCLNKHMLPYAYLEQERMTKQMTLLLSCAQYYKDQPNGQFALEALKKLADVGRFKPNEKSSLQSHK